MEQGGNTLKTNRGKTVLAIIVTAVIGLCLPTQLRGQEVQKHSGFDARAASKVFFDIAATRPSDNDKIKPAAQPTPKLKTADYVYWSSVFCVAGGTAFDAITTRQGIGRGAYENTSTLSLFGSQNKNGVTFLMIGVQGGLSLVNHFGIYRGGHPKAAAAMNFISSGVHFAAGIHNRGQR